MARNVRLRPFGSQETEKLGTLVVEVPLLRFVREDSPRAKIGGVLHRVNVSPFLDGRTGVNLRQAIRDEGGEMSMFFDDLLQDDFGIGPKECFRKLYSQSVFD